jgi:deoxyribonuclease-4
MLFGAQIRQTGGLLAALRRAEAMGAEVMQVFAQSPRQWRYPEANPDRAAAFGQAWPSSPVVKRVVCHAPYLANLATADDEVLDKSQKCLVDNLQGAHAMGALGLVLHLGSHLGEGFEARLAAVACSLAAVLDEAWAGGAQCPILLENTAGAGGTIGRNFQELARVIDASGSDPRLGVCLDTQHLWASGVSFSTPSEADAVIRALRQTVGLDRLACVHVNDSKVGLGAGLDRHENVGQGAIGEAGFRALLGHPRLQGLPAVLEVPGTDNRGPDAIQLATVRRLHAEGVRLRRRRDAPSPRPARGSDGQR